MFTVKTTKGFNSAPIGKLVDAIEWGINADADFIVVDKSEVIHYNSQVDDIPEEIFAQQAVNALELAIQWLIVMPSTTDIVAIIEGLQEQIQDEYIFDETL